MGEKKEKGEFSVGNHGYGCEMKEQTDCTKKSENGDTLFH